MKNISTFQVILLSVFGILILVGLLVFSGVIPGFRKNADGQYGTVVLWGTIQEGAFSDFISQFNSANKNVLKIQYVSKSPATFESELVEALANGVGPDLIILPSDLVYRQGNKIYPIPYESLSVGDFKDTYVGGAEIFLTSAGSLALPILVDPLVFYYNRDLLASNAIAEPPATWQQFREVAKKINQIDTRGNITRTAIAMGEFSNISNAKNILSLLLLQAGTPIVSITNTGYVSSLSDNLGFSLSPGQAALDFFTQFANPSKTTYSWNRSLPEAKDAFAAGSLATYFGLASELPDLRAKNPNLNLGVALVPQRNTEIKATFGRVYGLAILKSSKKTAGAAQAAISLAGKNSGSEISTIVGLPSARRDVIAAGSPNQWLSSFNDSALIVKTWLDPDPVATYQIFANAASRVLTGQSLPLDAIGRANQELNALLGR